MIRRLLAGARDLAVGLAMAVSLAWVVPPPAARPLNELAERMHREHVKLVESIDREALRAARRAAVDAAGDAARHRRGAGWFLAYTVILTALNVWLVVFR